MLHTEDQAREKWCPLVRAGNEAGCNRNWVAGDGRLDGCIGSACMAWRWGEAQGRTRPPIDRKFCILPPKDGRKWLLDDDGDGTTVDDYLSYLQGAAPTHSQWWYVPDPNPDDLPRRGYCGHFGKPGWEA